MENKKTTHILHGELIEVYVFKKGDRVAFLDKHRTEELEEALKIYNSPLRKML